MAVTAPAGFVTREHSVPRPASEFSESAAPGAHPFHQRFQVSSRSNHGMLIQAVSNQLHAAAPGHSRRSESTHRDSSSIRSSFDLRRHWHWPHSIRLGVPARHPGRVHCDTVPVRPGVAASEARSLRDWRPRRLRHCLSVDRAWPNWCCRRQLTSSSPKGTQARVPVHPIILFQVIFTKNYNIDSVLLEQLESLQGRLKTGVRRSRTLSGQLISRKPKPESVNSSKTVALAAPARLAGPDGSGRIGQPG
jgi:hypothetical protein